MKIFFIIALVLFSNLLFAQSTSIFLDGHFDEWENYSPVFIDSVDQSEGEIDFQSLWITNDSLYLYLCIEVGREINLQEENLIRLIIVSNNEEDNLYVTYNFGERKLTLTDETGFQSDYNHSKIELVSAPTVSSDIFEIRLRTSLFSNGTDYFPSDSIKIKFDDNFGAGDKLPDSGYISYYIDREKYFEYPKYSITKKDPDYLRVLSYNVLYDGLFDRQEIFARILPVLSPDIIGFQEIYDHSPEQVAQLVGEMIPLNDGEQWYNGKENGDIIVLSRFPILESWFIPSYSGSSYGNGAFLIDAAEKYGTNILFINAHPPCCANNEYRQQEIDAFMSFIREAKEPGGELTIDENTPIIIVGDMNLVGYSSQLNTLLTGDIFNNSVYGDDFNPDWDGTALEDALAPVNELPLTFTWYSESSSYVPGHLDYIVYSGSVMEKTNSFVLFTPVLPADTLDYYGLYETDALNASDHLPVVADFDLSPQTNIHHQSEIPGDFKLYQNYPNPFNPETVISYELPFESRVELKIFDVLGRQITTLVDEIQQAGLYNIHYSIKNNQLPTGVYFYEISADEYHQVKKMILMR
ncbi:MAG: T9SS type A sorting domain-containing protein [Melioribacteraceae bacterium]|nr:T9SS type A sorting domain-containing protein [Melioribacteraceae bacterium]MCF8353391.1 T9SS type A sorting domain-containing protein [Melioribacteraceae bacterium]MCF8393030.1 T9SS type A sorting domain-containing protein [Melioribacteraceae bacterium]MCF8419117.1 T9SS type A sorting domain-containing protein [Melioribacteraceae bacterium]